MLYKNFTEKYYLMNKETIFPLKCFSLNRPYSMISKTVNDTVQGQTRHWKSCSMDLKTSLSLYSSGKFFSVYLLFSLC